MTAFVFTGWLTFGLAAILGYQNAINDFRALKSRSSGSRPSKDTELHHDQSEASNSIPIVPTTNQIHVAFDPPAPSPGPLYIPRAGTSTSLPEELESRWVKIARGIFAPLCDLQVATGTAILVAGLVQGSKLTYYHELIIASYWNITLNSFWAAQISNPKYCDVKDLPSLVRHIAVICSAILSIYFQIRATIHQYWPGYWDIFTPGRCYLLPHDHSREPQAWFWIVGLSIYVVILVIRVLPVRQDFLGYISFDYLDVKIESYFTKRESFDVVSSSISNGTHGANQPRITFRDCQWLKVPCRIIAFLITSFLAVWSYGSGCFGIESVAILGYLSWNTLDVIDAKVANLHLIDPPESEMSWGFGQVLPMVLLVTVIFSAFDVFGEVKEKENKQ